MGTEVTMPVFVRVGDTEAQWGTITFTDEDGPLTESTIWREMAPFLRAVADRMENPAETGEGVDDAAPE